ncbi:O-methyltransferase [Photorhabdus sp. RM126S]|uniref:O-methyltransferase n=1 Tax=Photorhabdus sp. RM126S TaxID=3342826 RepID=UPI000AB885A7
MSTISNIIIKSIQRAILKSLNGDNNIKFLPLSNFCYSDGQQMVTITGILIKPEEEDNLINNAKLLE